MARTSAYRAEENTPGRINQRIQQETVGRVARLARADADTVTARLQELDDEWDLERALETTASTLSLVGLGLAATRDTRWLILPGVVTGFLLQHALQGWCPPLPVFRALGFRTVREIDEERYALGHLQAGADGVGRA
jgi:hypothetical protein